MLTFAIYKTNMRIKQTKPALKKLSNIPEIYGKMFGKFRAGEMLPEAGGSDASNILMV